MDANNYCYLSGVTRFFKAFSHNVDIYKLYMKNFFFFHLQVIDETLSPTWDELLIFEEVLVYGRREDIKANPPMVIIEIYDQDKVSHLISPTKFHKSQRLKH